MIRTTFLSAESPLDNARVQPDGSVEVKNLRAAKQIRIREPLPSWAPSAAVSLEWAPTLLDLPFDPPVGGVGTRLFAEIGVNISEIEAFAYEAAGLRLESPVNCEEWLNWITPADPHFTREELAGADAVRLSVNPKSQELVLEAWFSERVWDSTLAVTDHKSEVGLFKVSRKGPSTFQLEGRTRVLGSEASEPVLMFWHSRNLPSEGAMVSAHFLEPYGLHPKLEMEVDVPQPQEFDTCSLYAFFEVPSDVFIDQYEVMNSDLGSPLGLWGNLDLERAQWDRTEGSIALFKLPGSGNFSLPLHFRYAAPNDQMEQVGELPGPRVFWTCKNDLVPERSPEFVEPRETLGIESVFPLSNSVFVNAASKPVSYRIPAIGKHEGWVGVVTAAVVVLQALFLLIVMYKRRKPDQKVKND